MLFNSWQYAVFFPIVLISYYLLPRGKKWIMLLAASYFFYMCWNPALILLMLFSTVVHYFAALKMERMRLAGEKKSMQKRLLVLSVGISLVMLLLFKYFDFFSRSAHVMAGWLGIHYSPLLLSLTLPMGISFYTFQTLSYTIDVYRGDVPAERNFGYFSLFITFFPQLVAGPIERIDRLLPQLKEEHPFQYDNVTSGFAYIALGLFKKMVIADTLAKGVETVYSNVRGFTGFPLLAATVLFAFQIYCDFSGYSDIAMGSARAMGIRLMYNFRSPYLSSSIREFWSRWHISLSTWFKDYVYIPLGGSRCGKLRNAFNLLATFLLSGLWHGANWTFVIWGALHGFYQIVEKAFTGNRAKCGKKLSLRALPQIALTFVLVCLAWVFFRANTLQDAIYVLGHLFDGVAHPAMYLKNGVASLNLSVAGCMLLIFELALLVLVDIIGYSGDPVEHIRSFRWYVRWPVYVCLAAVVVILSTKGTVSEFIYFQF